MSLLVLGGSGYLGQAVVDRARARGTTVLAVSRSGATAAGEGLRGDVLRPGFGLPDGVLERLADEVTHGVMAHGSVDWTCSPSEAAAVHDSGMQTVLRSLRALPRLARAVHVSSLLVLGRATGTLGNRELFVGQNFRNWYEYGKYCAEHHVRAA